MSATLMLAGGAADAGGTARARGGASAGARPTVAVESLDCPAVTPPTSAASAGDESGTKLVSATPTGALICRYDGLPEPGSPSAGAVVVGQARLGRAGAEHLARQFDALGPLPSGSIACPADFGTAAEIYFAAARGTVQRIGSALSGCESSGNGRITRAGVPAAVSALTPNSASLISAHQSIASGTVIGFRAGMTLLVRASDGRVTASVGVARDGHFHALVAAGRDTFELVHDFVSSHPRRLATLTQTVRGGHATRITFGRIDDNSSARR